ALIRALGAPAARSVRVLIGRDTRESGEWIAEALIRGLSSEQSSAVSVGVLPTPAIAFLTRAEGFDAGIVISASHNPYGDNGIKIFSGRGEKLDGAFESRIEQLVGHGGWSNAPGATPPLTAPELPGRYVAHLRNILRDAGPLAGSRLVVDCANGATTTIAPALFRALGFDLVTIGDEPNGRNINLNCGSTHLEPLRAAVIQQSARLGVAFDGDGDRALFVDRRGSTVDGDAILLLAAKQLLREGRLPGSSIVATVMSNIGLEHALREHGIGLIRAPVGDKYVMEEMLKRGLALGGEQSGHIIFADHLFTGDGIGTALQVLRIMVATGRELDELAGELVTYPQVLINVRVRERTDYMTIPAIADSIRDVEQRLEGHGRLLIRYSGTEPLLRIMLEGKDDAEIREWANEIAESVREQLGE
ncbi:MAG: phosphoglucosamine mutase, partial [Vicinamibacterales bacterium]